MSDRRREVDTEDHAGARARAMELAASALCLCAVCLAAPAAEHPSLVYSPADRATVRARLDVRDGAWSPSDEGRTADRVVNMLTEMWRRDMGRALKRRGRGAEGGEAGSYGRSNALLDMAILAWVEPRLAMPDGRAVGERIRTAVRLVTVPTRRIREYFPPPDGDQSQPGAWGRFLDAGVALWNHSLAHDMLRAPHVAASGVNDELLDEHYRRIADGIFHLLVEHMRTYPKWHNWGKRRPIGNNWNSREMAGVGMACLAFADRLRAEPAGSQRRRDFEDGLRLFRELSTEYLEGWREWGGADDESSAYYVEGPHYLRYWVEYYLPVMVAHRRAFPDATDRWPALGLSPDAPVARFLRAMAMLAAPTHRDKNGRAAWGPLPYDDAWLYPDDVGVPMILAAAWVGDESPRDRELFGSLAARTGTRRHPLLLGNPVMRSPLGTGHDYAPSHWACRKGGVALLRTGPAEGDLLVGLKNTPGSVDDKTREPTLFSHSHQDACSVVAYRDAEPILVDPGYGPDGYSNKGKTTFFSGWNRHNTLMVEDAKGYARKLRERIGEKGTFVLPVWEASGRRPPPARITRCEPVRPGGASRIAETISPAHTRTVILVDRDHLLVVDRLDAPVRVKLAWFGNGAESDDTCRVGLGRAEAVYTRGPRTKTRVTVHVPTDRHIEKVDGEYGPFWYRTKYPLTGMWVTSRRPVRYAVTLVEVCATTEGRFTLRAEATPAPDGRLDTVVVSDDTGVRGEYRFDTSGRCTQTR